MGVISCNSAHQTMDLNLMVEPVSRCPYLGDGMRKWLLGACRAGLAISMVATALAAAMELPAHGAAAIPPAGYGAGAGYCTSYAGGVTSAYTFDGVYACGGSTTGATTFDNPGAGGQFTVMSENNANGAAAEQTLPVDLGGGHNGQVSHNGTWAP